MKPALYSLVAILFVPGADAQVVAVKASAPSPVAPHPATSVPSDAGYKLLGGGALIDWTGNGSLLDQSRPQPGLAGWQASGKDHFYPDPARITAYALQLEDAADLYEVIVRETQSPVAAQPTTRATLPTGYVMTGGGCFVNWRSTPSAPGNLLTGSYPDETDKRTWICQAQEHLGPSPASIQAYVIGVRPRSSTTPLPMMTITKSSSPVGAAPRATAGGGGTGFLITGGGARAEPQVLLSVAPLGQPPAQRVRPNRSGPAQVATPQTLGVLLTASFPVDGPGPMGRRIAVGWEARAKDHGVSSPGTVTAYAISVKFPVPPMPMPCACTKTGPFAVPQGRTISSSGLTGMFSHPTDGNFAVSVTPMTGTAGASLDVKDAQNRTVLSHTGAAAWGPSPDGRFFAVVDPPVGTNAGAPVTVFRVKRGPGTMPSVVSNEVWPDGQWAWSADGSQFIITRLQQAPTRFSLDAYNLLAMNPTSAVLRFQEQGMFGSTVAVSPCGDRLMYFRWTQLSPRTGQADFYSRKSFGGAQSTVFADWDQVAPTTPTAQEEAVTGTMSFLVRMNGLRLRSNGQTTFPSIQCTP